MPSLVALSDVSAIGDNVIPQLNSILAATPLPPISSISDITPSLLLDLYELLFRIKLAYATPRDLSPDSQLRNIRVLIGHIAHDILKMDLSFLEPQKICDRDERALGDFLRIFLGVAKLRKAHLEKGGSNYQQRVIAGDTGSPGKASFSNRRRGDDELSMDGSEHTVRATPRKDNVVDVRPKEDRIVVRGTNPTPRRSMAIVRKTPSKPIIHEDYIPEVYSPSRNFDITESDLADRLANPLPPGSDISSVPSDFIHGVNERVSNIWSRLNSRTNRQISDKISEHPSSHSPRRPLSTISQDTNVNLPTVPENPANNIPTRPHRSQTASSGPSLAEPTPAMKAWLENSGMDGSISSHKPRSTQTTPEKRPPLQSTHTAPANIRNRPYTPTDTPSRPHTLSASTRSKSSLVLRSRRDSSATPPQFALERRRRSATPSPPPPSHLNIDLGQAMFSNSPIRISGHANQAKHRDSDSSEDEVDGDIDDTSSEVGSSTSSIATSALSVSSIEWSDTASIRELRRIRLAALEEIKREQEAVLAEEEKVAAVALARAQDESTRFQTDEEEEETQEVSANQIVYTHNHNRRRSSIPSTFMHHGKSRSVVSYETISPNSSASVAAERWKARWRNEISNGISSLEDGSPAPRRVMNAAAAAAGENYHVFDDEGEGGEEYDDEGEEEEEGSVMTTRNTEDLEMELKGLEGMGLSESKRQIMLFESLIRRAVDKRPPGS
ncbi:hypothetical protein H072_3577 [Dactylellina haptotyla CBS 200.50]|uniref:DUF5745 domain-containing protein n=1 Tax=Dactylellina haptotyla (strain CBS 200.50) TaxID=1284197 RepID=S8AHW7_DACHA|nr:hypothetical protein H072_3577 [Dactylellina haptotyla CBS 200.50]